MITRTVLEWGRLPYGEDPARGDTIPMAMADRLAAVARRTGLGGEDGGRILQHGRNAIRAGQIVGVLVAEGCTLEILPKIDLAGVGEDHADRPAALRRELIHSLIPIPVPGVGTVTLGIGGGPLIVALILGRLRRTRSLSWVMPLPANIVLRNLGLTLFLATVGINSGQAFVTTVAQTGPAMLLIGMAALLTTMAVVLIVGFYMLKIPFDDLLGVASGATGNPAILAYAGRTAPTDRPDICYAMIFPSMTIVKVFSVQIIGLLFFRV